MNDGKLITLANELREASVVLRAAIASQDDAEERALRANMARNRASTAYQQAKEALLEHIGQVQP